MEGKGASLAEIMERGQGRGGEGGGENGLPGQ